MDPIVKGKKVEYPNFPIINPDCRPLGDVKAIVMIISMLISFYAFFQGVYVQVDTDRQFR